MFRSSATTHGAFLLTAFALSGGVCRADNTEDSEAAYTKVISGRADKIVGTLGITDDAAAVRVHDLIVQHYRNLREIHDARDAKIGEAKNAPAADAEVAKAWIGVARDAANLKLIGVHRRFVAQLSVELSPEQMDKVKDGLTYGVVPLTYKRYLELFPNLNDEQKREILANLREAREFAMDAGSSEEKHALFGKYKGRINNYLSAAGYDSKKAERDLADRKKAASQSR